MTTQERILEAAGRLLAERGADATAIRDVCAAVGVTPPTIYHHFGDKDGLLDAVVDAAFARFAASLHALPPELGPLERLGALFDAYLRFGLEHPHHYQVLFGRPMGDAVRPAGLSAYSALLDAVRAVEEAHLLVVPFDVAVATCWSMAHGTTSLLLNCPVLMSTRAHVPVMRGAAAAAITGRVPAPDPGPAGVRRRAR